MQLRIASSCVCSLLLGALSGEARADAPTELAPPLYEQGNLRLAVSCAGRFVTPALGLRVVLDGSPLGPVRMNALTGVALDSSDQPVIVSALTDVGFLAPAGRHRVRIEAPDCRPDEREVDLSASHAVHVEGPLALADPELLGPAGAPDGIGFALGPFLSSYPGADEASIHGFWLSTSLEGRSLAGALDHAVGWGSVPGAGSQIEYSLTLRIGGRLPLRSLALEAGSGIGASLWMPTGSAVEAREEPVLTWYVPLWASLTIKPWCDWGVQALASYDVEPTDLGANVLAATAGLVWQPSASCSEEPGLSVSP